MATPSVLTEKVLNKDNVDLYHIFKFKDNMPKLVGTSSLESQAYPADIDMLCPVKDKPKGAFQFKKQFQTIFKKIANTPNLFFIEFKLQNKPIGLEDDVQKFKFYKLEDVDGTFFRDNYKSDLVDLCKIDLVQYLPAKGVFQEISCIYFLNPEQIDKINYIGTLLKDQKHYCDEGKFYKSLKRFMVACKLQEPPNTNVIIGISNFFNSAVGEIYQRANYIMACQIYIEKFGVDDRVRFFIKKIGLDIMPSDELQAVADDYSKVFNHEAKLFYETYHIPIGHLLPFQKKRL